MPGVPEELRQVVRPRSAFWYFHAERKADLAKPNAEGKALLATEIMRICNGEWEAKADAEKQKYMTLATQDVVRYEKERGAIFKAKGLPPPEPYVRMADRKKLEKKRLFNDMDEASEGGAEAATGPRRILKAKRLGAESSSGAAGTAFTFKAAMMDTDGQEDEEAAPKRQKQQAKQDVSTAKAKPKKTPKFAPIDPRDKLERIRAEAIKQEKQIARPKAPRTARQQLHKTMRRMRVQHAKKITKRALRNAK
eukprot:TRINITY_DN5829_c0_g1_i1.p1 TRINITY_DN5829_c0_g1~~TRINITY_DN5829_c0_g1_i1.p1  ORF type:complete len:258 (+),score=94.91 TRINITY_DN5829_c0_g1_i1:23-775(+)